MGSATAALRPLNSVEARRICTLSGVQAKLYSQRLVTLRDLETTLLRSLGDLDRAANQERRAADIIVTLRLARLICDITIGLAAEADKAGIAGKAVSAIYDRATLIVESLNRPDTAKLAQAVGETHLDVVGGGLDMAGKQAWGKALSHVKLLAKAVQSAHEAFDEYRQSTQSALPAARRTVVAQLERIRAQVRELNAALSACGVE